MARWRVPLLEIYDVIGSTNTIQVCSALAVTPYEDRNAMNPALTSSAMTCPLPDRTSIRRRQ